MAKDPQENDGASNAQYYGSLVAFEGKGEVISTQLRMLPTSPQVLILPDVRHYMREDNNTHFDTRSYTRDVLEAVEARRKVAMQFLSQSSPENKRLVFLNGGTAGAVAHCISAISDGPAHGDIVRAETIFRRILSEDAEEIGQEKRYSNEEALKLLSSGQGRQDLPCEQENEDPITKAMRAADALYQETESLQPIECYIRTRPRSLSLPMLGYTNDMGESSPFFVFGPPPNENEDSQPQKEEDAQACHQTASADRSSRRHSAGPSMLGISLSDHPLSPIAEEGSMPLSAEIRPPTQLSFTTTDHYSSPPASPGAVVYGEARLVQMQAAKSQKALRRTRSLDDMELSEACRRRLSVQMRRGTGEKSTMESNENKTRHLSIAEDVYSSKSPNHLPLARFVKAHTTTIRRSPVIQSPPELGGGADASHRPATAHGLDGDEDTLEESQPVLPLHEDLVIHFTSETQDQVLNSVIQKFKRGSYSIASTHAESSVATAETDSCPSTPRTADLFDLEEDGQIGLSPVMEVPSGDEAEEYDPFAVRGDETLQRLSSAVLRDCRPPTPAQTPLPGESDADSKFYDFSTVGRPNAVATQNALRMVLEVYFPPNRAGGYHQFGSPLLHSVDSLWRPIFGVDSSQDAASGESTVDIVLAIGSQKGVKREFSSSLTGQIERLGTKSNGMSRSGRLDIRYLIANAVQSFSTQPLMQQKQINPFENPSLLACLMIPHLETYLAASITTRFLVLEYPTEHLATVLALRKLIGSDMFKVAGIIDLEVASPSTCCETVSPQHKPGAQNGNPVARNLDSVSLPGSPFPNNNAHGGATIAHRRRLSFSRANYLLTSSATDGEIATFISKIWRVLIDIDSFYAPEQPQASPTYSSHHMLSSKSSLPGLVSKFTTPCSPPVSPPGYPLPLPPLSSSSSRIIVRDESPSRGSDRSGSLRGAHQQQHIAIMQQQYLQYQKQQQRSPSASVSSTSSPRSPRRPARRREPEEPAVTYVAAGPEEGDFYDDEERRLMPMYMRHSEMRKGNSRKALRWLGLA